MVSATVAVALLALGGGLELAAQVLPLGSRALAGRLIKTTPGPIERRATFASPDHPIPRRIWVVPAEYPTEASAIGMRATVRLRVVVDEFGNVAETRLPDVPIVAAFDPAGDVPASQRDAALDALAISALDAVGQWRYEPSAERPLAFDVAISFGPDVEARVEALVPRIDPPPVALPLTGNVVLDPPPEWVSGATRVGGGVRSPGRVNGNGRVAYPPEARAASVQGTIVLDIRIEPDGHVSHARVLRSIPELDRAALDAVMLWEFSPPLVNDNPAPVLMTVTMQFTTQ